MPSHWGDRDAAHRLAVERRPARSACRPSAAPKPALLYERLTDIPDRESQFEADEVTYVSVGDGATSEGEFWESLNAACLRKLPVLFLVEDNGYAISVPVEAQTPGGSISRLVESFPEPARSSAATARTSSTSYRAMTEAVGVVPRAPRPGARARDGDPPVLAFAFRRRARVQDGRRSAPRKRRAIRLSKFARVPARRTASSTDADLAEIAQDVDREVNEAADAAVQGAEADAGHGRRCTSTRRTSIRRRRRSTRPREPDGKPDTMVAAINRTLKDEMAANPRIVVFGEDVADATHETNLAEVPGKGGVFKVTLGLQRAFGSDRVFNSHARRSRHRRPRRAAWARAGSSRSSRFSSSTTSGRR